jgi:RNA polymerase sigma factor (sigma-70 family)
MLRDPRDIEDAFQATFLILVRKAPAIRDRGLLANWLYGVAFRVARRVRGQTLRQRNRELGVANLEAPVAPESADSLELGLVLDQELNRLPRKYRLPLVLCYLNGRTHDQAAVELECPVGTVRSRLARGRDLLRRRLTTGGYAPTAAILSNEAALPAKLLGEAVPPSLVSATVKAAFAIGASKPGQTGAISAAVLALTQGVLTTMRIAYWKTVGLAIMATCLSASGVFAVAYASRQNDSESKSENSTVTTVPDAGTKLSVGQADSKSEATKKGAAPTDSAPEQRLESLEKKVDQLLSRSGLPAAGAARNAADPFSNDSAPARRAFSPAATVEPTNRAIRDLEGELKQAMLEWSNTRALFNRGAIVSSNEVEIFHAKVLRVQANLQGLDDDLADELARIRLEIKKKKAEVEQATAQQTVATSTTLRNRRLNDRKAGMVDDATVAKGEGELKASEVQVQIKAIELEELELRVRQLESRRERIKRIVRSADATPDEPSRSAKNAN